ncbi:hypothetical protein OXX80_008101 [Metschnikowia pulcherrima]
MRHERSAQSDNSNSLTRHEEIALKRVWAIILRSCGYDIELSYTEMGSNKYFTSSYRRDHDDKPAKHSPLPRSETSNGESIMLNSDVRHMRNRAVYFSLEAGLADDDDVFSFCDHAVHPFLTGFVSEDLHKALWESCRKDSADNFILSFLRVNNFDVEASVKMVAEALDWRINAANVDTILCQGDAHFLGNSPELTHLLENNELFIRGRSRNGCPLIFVRTRIHFRQNCPDEDFEKLVLLIFEWARLGFDAKNNISQCHVVFDLTGFSMKNADFHAMRFVIKTAQMRYPSMCQKVYIHRAPKVFNIMWKIIYPWLKPHVRDIISFTSTYEHLHENISSRHIAKSLGGKASEAPRYVGPHDASFQRKSPDSNFDRLIAERDDLTARFVHTTVQWIESKDCDESRDLLKRRKSLSNDRATNYTQVDPYLRKRGLPDRNCTFDEASYL